MAAWVGQEERMAEREEEFSNLNWRQRAGYYALRALVSPFRLLSVRQCARLGEICGAVAYRCMDQRRRVVVNNLRIVFNGTKGLEECERIAREVFRRTGANMVGGHRLGLLPSEKIPEYVEIRETEHMRKALDEGRGALILIGHMGPWEGLAQMGDRLFLGAPHGSFYRPIDNPVFDAFIHFEREKRGARLFSRKDGLSGPVALLREGGALGIVGDQRVGKGGVSAPFFGRVASTTRLPYILHKKTGSPVVSMSVRTVETGKWVVEILPVVYPEREGLETREAFTRRCNELLEEALRVSVEDVFWFHRRWRPGKRPFFPAGASECATVARRVLIVLPDSREAAIACAKGIAAYGEGRPGFRFVLAGSLAAGAAREAGLPEDAEYVVQVPESVGKREIAALVDSVDRLGPVGIDGALVFGDRNATEWGKALRTVGLKIVLGMYGRPRYPGISPAFHAPEPPADSDAFRGVLEELSE